MSEIAMLRQLSGLSTLVHRLLSASFESTVVPHLNTPIPRRMSKCFATLNRLVSDFPYHPLGGVL